jgi:hypothetical protein
MLKNPSDFDMSKGINPKQMQKMMKRFKKLGKFKI